MTGRRGISVFLVLLLVVSPLQGAFAGLMVTMVNDKAASCCKQQLKAATVEAEHLNHRCADTEISHGDQQCDGDCAQCSSCVSVQMIQPQTVSATVDPDKSIPLSIIPLLSVQQDTELHPPIISA
jgi:hypothetical protein